MIQNTHCRAFYQTDTRKKPSRTKSYPNQQKITEKHKNIQSLGTFNNIHGSLSPQQIVYQELKSPKPVLPLGFFAADSLVEGLES